MLARWFSTLLCVSTVAGVGATAHASELFVVQLRLPARNVTLDIFATRTANGVEVPGSALAYLGIAAPDSDELIALSSVPGLAFEERVDEGAIVIICAMACYSRQRVDLNTAEADPDELSTASGGYFNYEADLQWIEDENVQTSGLAEAVLFGKWGLIESSWLGYASGDNARFTRLESSWTIDNRDRGVRTRIGDSVFVSASGAPVRFGGIQIGRYFGLTPSLITYPTPLILGDAQSASTVQLYVDGVLRARSEVEAGPFTIDHAPVISGGGQAELVITDVLGRQQTITRSFFVSTTMLRRGLSDWSAALGAERRAFGYNSDTYGDTFAAVRYRRGITDSLTLEAAVEGTNELTTFQAGFTAAQVHLGQVYFSRSANSDGGYISASWSYDGRAITVGAQFEQRDGVFRPLGRSYEDGFNQGVAGSFAYDMGDHGSFGFTAAQTEFDAEPRARTITFSYTPDYGDGALSFRAVHTEREESDLSVAVSWSIQLADGSAHVSAEHGRHGMTYRGSMQRAVEPGRMGWRARGAVGGVERLEVAAMTRGALGDTMAEVGVANGVGGARVRHAGSVGWIESLPFAGRRIDGSFALVDGGAPNVSVARNRLDMGETGADGRRLVTNLQPYRNNMISISADDLPIDRAPANPVQRVAVAEGAGAVVRFTEAEQRLVETHVAFANGEAAPRGSVMVRDRDQRRFPVGSDGRIVLQGAEDGDRLTLGACAAVADEATARQGLTLICAAMS